MAAGPRERVERALAKLGIPYQDVSDPEDASVTAAFFTEAPIGPSGVMPVVVTLSKEQSDVWVQGGADLPEADSQTQDRLSAAVDAADSALRRAPASLFSEHKLPRFRQRGFDARLSWSPRRRQIVATIVIPASELSAATIAGAIALAARLGNDAASEIGRAIHEKTHEDETGGAVQP